MAAAAGTALLTGGRGFVGRAIVGGLRQAGWRTITIGPPRTGDGPDHWPTAGPRDADRIAQALEAWRPRLVVHLAAARPTAPPAEQQAVTVAGTTTLLAALARADRAPLLLALGSAAEFGPVPPDAGRLTEAWPCAPASAHGLAKHDAMRAVLRHARDGRGPACVLRLFTAAGPGAPSCTLLGRIGAEIAALPGTGGVVRVAGPARERDYLPVAEVARLVAALAARGPALPPLVNLCSGHGITVRDWVAALAQARGVAVEIEPREDGARRDDPLRVIGDPALLGSLGLAAAPFGLGDIAAQVMAPWRG